MNLVTVFNVLYVPSTCPGEENSNLLKPCAMHLPFFMLHCTCSNKRHNNNNDDDDDDFDNNNNTNNNCQNN